jgi:hypothetical protein
VKRAVTITGRSGYEDYDLSAPQIKAIKRSERETRAMLTFAHAAERDYEEQYAKESK